MQISVIIFISDTTLFQETYQSVKSQHYSNTEIVIVYPEGKTVMMDDSCKTMVVNANDGFYDSYNKAIELAGGDYVIFLKSGDVLTNDRVLEEFSLNSPVEDLVFGNTIVVKNAVESYVFIADTLRMSDIASKELPVQNIFFKRKELLTNYGFDISFPDEAARFFCLNLLTRKEASYRHINFFIATLREYAINLEELRNGLIKYAPVYAEDMLELMQHRTQEALESTKVLRKFRESNLFQSIMQFRKFAEKKGFYELTAQWKKKRYYKQISRRDETIRKETVEKIMALDENLLTRNNDASDIIVSLTSFGHRVADSAPYAIYTLFTQKRLPNRIILFLDNDNWNSTNIPALLQKLQKSGLEIMFCEDIRPYKKLIPTMRLFPQNTIITVDDDVYYNDNTISELLEVYEKSDKKSVICHWALIAEQRKGRFIPYSLWKDNIYGNLKSFLSPVGQDGVLYPAGVFDEEMLKSDIFMKLCTNDDLWFWIQEYLKKIEIKIVPFTSKSQNQYVDTIAQWAPTKDSALYFLNAIQGQNDINLLNLFQYYGIQDSY